MNKLEELYNLSNQIIESYNYLITIYEYDNNQIPSPLINDIKELVLSEHNLLQTISSKEINIYLEQITQLEDKEKNPVWTRIRDKLIEHKEFLNGNFITSKDLELTNIPKNFPFGIYDVIISMISIEVIKKIKNKIYYANIFGNNDEEFINSLKKELEIAKINFLLSNNTSEIISLYNSLNIEKIPNIDIIKIITSQNNIYLNNLIIDSILDYYSKKYLNTCAKIKIINNNPKDVFQFLLTITYLEVLISYMNDNMKISLYNYCCNLNNIMNINIINHAKKLIKSKKEN